MIEKDLPKKQLLTQAVYNMHVRGESGVDLPSFVRGEGGLSVMHSHMPTARGRVREGAQKLLPCVSNVYIFYGVLHLFICSCQSLLASVFVELASYLILLCCKQVVSGLDICLPSCSNSSGLDPRGGTPLSTEIL